MDRVVVEGVSYRWKRIEDGRNGSLGFNYRGMTFPDTIEITGDDGSAISFVEPESTLSQPGWWRGPAYVTDQAIERAIRIAARRESKRCVLGAAEAQEALYGPFRTLQDELNTASATLAANDIDTFVDCILAIGCHAHGPSVAIDDWIASHANELVDGRLQRLLVTSESNHDLYCYRSAIAFLLEMCARMNVEPGLDLTDFDVALKTRRHSDVRPWGIPESHWWWRQGRYGAWEPARGPDED